MLFLEAEVTRTSVPPNKAETEREIAIWIFDSENEIELTMNLEDFQKNNVQVGDKLSIKIEKRPDFDSMARELFKDGK